MPIPSSTQFKQISTPRNVMAGAPFDLGPDLQWIPAGKFIAGAAKDDPNVQIRKREVMKPYGGQGSRWGVTQAPAYEGDRLDFEHHEAEVGGFYIFRRLVSNAQFSEFMQALGKEDKRYRSTYSRIKSDLPPEFAGADQPAVGITCSQAREYSSWIAAQLRKKTGHAIIGRLPTEFEWEKAAKGPNSDEYVTPATAEEAHCNAEATRIVTSPDAKPNGYGLYDMIGNAAEFTGSRLIIGGEILSYTVIRGGSYEHEAGNKHLRAASRPWYETNSLGISFRPVITL